MSRQSVPPPRHRRSDPAARRDPRILGVVLAGGRSSRMGVDKATLWLDREVAPRSSVAGGSRSSQPKRLTFLDHAIERLVPLVNRIVVAGRSIEPAAGSVRLPTPQWLTRGGDPVDVLGIADDPPGLGPATGVAMSLRQAIRLGYQAVLVTPIDMPDLTTDHLARLIARWAQTQRVVCAEFTTGRPEPMPAIYPAGYTDEIEILAASDHRGLRGWLAGQPFDPVALPAEASRNVNRPEDLTMKDWR